MPPLNPVVKSMLSFLLLLPCMVKGQCMLYYPPDTSATRTRNVIFTTPVAKNSTINGLAIGFEPATWHGAQTLNINGVSISASPTDPFFALMALLFSINYEPKGSMDEDHYNSRHIDQPDIPAKKKFNGLILGSVVKNAHTNGVNVSAVINASKKMNGLSVSGLFNHHYSFKGVLIAGIRNKTTTGRGLQIGLLNRCKEGKLVQIGLLNRIGKRTIPFINFQF